MKMTITDRRDGWYLWGPEMALTQSLLSVHKDF